MTGAHTATRTPRTASPSRSEDRPEITAALHPPIEPVTAGVPLRWSEHLFLSAKRLRRHLKQWIELQLDALYDRRRFIEHAVMDVESLNLRQLRARLLMRAHSLEKGLSLESVRPLFGKVKLRELTALLTQYRGRSNDRACLEYQKAIAGIRAYCEFHMRNGIDAPAAYPFLEPWLQLEHTITAGTIEVEREGLLRAAAGDYATLARSRHSIRQFDQREVDLELVERSVRIAQKAPSVCNRQSVRIHVVTDRCLKAKALEIQGGSAGFSDDIPLLLIVTSDLSSFARSRERNQPFIDGGLFSMSLLHSLQTLGLGACPLNWSAGRKKDRRLRAAVPLPQSETVIMMIAVGHLKERFVVAASPRLSLSDVLRVY